MGYKNNAFINCPFDEDYRTLIEKLIFILEFYDYNVEMSVALSSAHDRLEEISKKIKDSKFTFHDLSRNVSGKKGELARFNMPFELGIDFGCYKYSVNRSDKVIAVMDSSPHAYDQYLSDLSGRDILYHQDNSELLFEVIPTWLTKSTGVVHHGSKFIKGVYASWITDYKSSLHDLGYDTGSIDKIDLEVYKLLLRKYLPVWKADNGYVKPI